MFPNQPPLFFLIFFNKLTHSLNCDADAFSDDTSITVQEIGSNMTENCELVRKWMFSNNIKFNAGKTMS